MNDKRQYLTDIHSHILPGVDDGPEDIKTSIAILEREYADGVRAVILTPHYRLDMFEATQEQVLASYEALKKAAAERFPDLTLYLGAEVHTHREMAEAVIGRPQLRMAGSDFVLVEFKENNEKSYIHKRLYRLRAHGLTPIIAHAERCEELRKDLGFLKSLKELGVRVQVNADSVLGYDGLRVKRFCRELMERDLLDYIGSDAHDVTSRPARIGECARRVEKKFGREYMLRIMSEDPIEIINGGKHGE